MQVVWNFPGIGWIKVNTNGVVKGSPGKLESSEIVEGSTLGVSQHIWGFKIPCILKSWVLFLPLSLLILLVIKDSGWKVTLFSSSSLFLCYGGSQVY